MNSSSRQAISSLLAVVVLSVATCGCEVFGGGTTLPDPGSDSEVAQNPAGPAERLDPELQATEILAESDPATLGQSESIPIAGGDAALVRLFALDALASELARAIQSGFDSDGSLGRKLRDVERELAWRRESLGSDRINQAWQLRLERLKRLPVVLR